MMPKSRKRKRKMPARITQVSGTPEKEAAVKEHVETLNAAFVAESPLPKEPEKPELTREEVYHAPGTKLYKIKPLDKVTILGLGRSVISWVGQAHSGNLVSHKNPGHEIWTLNWGCFVFKHDLAWNMHDDPADEIPLHREDMRALWEVSDKPIIMPFARRDWENSFEYPLIEVINHFHENYFSNTVPYMIALAIMSGVKEIEFFGCDYDYSEASVITEKGRSCVEYWIRWAKNGGVIVPEKDQIKITITDDTFLLDIAPRVRYGSLYGYKIQPNIYRDEQNELCANWGPSMEEVEASIEQQKVLEHNAAVQLKAREQYYNFGTEEKR